MKNKINCILLVDDDEATNYVNKIWLTRAGVAENIVVVDNGAQALDYLHHRGSFQVNGNTYPKPSVIFLDINMPVMDGWGFLEAYQRSNLEKCDIYMLSSSPNPDDEDRAKMISEVKGFYRKPISKELIQQLVSSGDLK